MPPKHLPFLIVILGLLALLTLPLTSLWALFAYLAGDRYPLFALRGKNIADPLDTEETKWYINGK